MNRDRLIALALVLVSWGEQISGGRENLALHLALAALMALPLGFARRHPWLPAAASAIALVAYGALGHEPDATGELFALAGACFVAGSRMSLRAGAITLGVLLTASALHLAQIGGIGDLLFVAGLFLVPPFALGRAVLGRRRRLEELEALNQQLVEERERTAALAAAAERARITRDLEAVVAAGLEAMIAGARRGERLVDEDPAAAAAAFESIRHAGAEATSELRRLLRLLQA